MFNENNFLNGNEKFNSRIKRENDVDGMISTSQQTIKI